MKAINNLEGTLYKKENDDINPTVAPIVPRNAAIISSLLFLFNLTILEVSFRRNKFTTKFCKIKKSKYNTTIPPPLNLLYTHQLQNFVISYE
jgi:hypothetical protein